MILHIVCRLISFPSIWIPIFPSFEPNKISNSISSLPLDMTEYLKLMSSWVGIHPNIPIFVGKTHFDKFGFMFYPFFKGGAWTGVWMIECWCPPLLHLKWNANGFEICVLGDTLENLIVVNKSSDLGALDMWFLKGNMLNRFIIAQKDLPTKCSCQWYVITGGTSIRQMEPP